MCQSLFPHCRMASLTSRTLKPITLSYPAPTSQLLGTTSLAREIGVGHELLYLVVQREGHLPSIKICAHARKNKVAEDVLEVALLGGPEDTLPPLHGRLLVKLTHSRQLHRILILKRPLRSLHPMLTKALHRLTHTRYRSGTRGFRDCTCVLALNKSPTIPIGPPKTPVRPKPQPLIHKGKLLVSRVVIRAEKTYTGLERERIFPVEVVLEELSKSKVAEEPCSRFKEWTSNLRGLEFTLAVTVPPVTPNIVFGPYNYEREPIQMVRCITADLLSDKYGVTCQPGEVYRPAQFWWLLVTASHTHALVQPDNLRSCLESLRTVVTQELILCFHIVDLYRGKLQFRWWLELIITLFANFPRIGFLEDWTHSFNQPVTIHAALGTLDAWSTANVDNQSLSRSVWQDLTAIRGQNHFDPANEKGPGR